MIIEFSGKIWYWRGPAPFHFVTVPPQPSQDIKEIANYVSYGWGMIPVTAEIGATRWQTSLFPKDGAYIVPIKDSIRRAEKLNPDSDITLRLTIDI